MANDLRTKLADTPEKATEAARSQVVKTSLLVRADRELLVERGYLQEIVKGWYILGRPVDKPGDSTAYFAVRLWKALDFSPRTGHVACMESAPALKMQMDRPNSHGGSVSDRLDSRHRNNSKFWLRAWMSRIQSPVAAHPAPQSA